MIEWRLFFCLKIKAIFYIMAAIRKTENKKFVGLNPTNCWYLWSGRRDSDPRPQPWQGCALPLSYFRSMFFELLVAGPRIELGTHGFSVRCSTY